MTRFLTTYHYEITVLLRLVLSSICGGIIGLERELKGRPAGLKTFSLVCLGATIAMISNEFIARFTPGYSGDVTRMAAQVISGIGFLGAGTIIVTRNTQIKGLNTAAALWASASIGIAIGAGFYFGGIAGVLVIAGTSRIYNYIDGYVAEHINIMKIFVEGENEKVLISSLKYFEQQGFRVENLQRTKDNKWFKVDTAAILDVVVGTKKHSEVLKELNDLPEVMMAREIERE